MLIFIYDAELSNHLGNVLATVSDKKVPIDKGSNGSIDYYDADVVTAQDYYPFGMVMPGRNFSSSTYRYGFNGQEKVDEISGSGNHNTAMFWEYDTRLGRRWNLDPKPNVGISGYSAFANNPILFNDPLGDTLSNPQLVGAMRIASNEIKDAIKNNRGFFVTGTNSRLLGAAEEYIKKNDLGFRDAVDFMGQVDAYHEGLSSVAMKSSEEFSQLDRSVINSKNLTNQQALKLTIGYIYNSDAQLRSILNISANVAIGEAAGGVGVRGGGGPVGPRINSNKQQAIVNRSFINQVPENLNTGQQGKHILGHNNYISGRSILTANPNDLLNQFHNNGTTILRQPNANRIIVDFHKPIGTYVNPEKGISVSTTRGTINFGKSGAHIVPSAPK